MNISLHNVIVLNFILANQYTYSFERYTMVYKLIDVFYILHFLEAGQKLHDFRESLCNKLFLVSIFFY